MEEASTGYNICISEQVLVDPGGLQLGHADDQQVVHELVPLLLRNHAEVLRDEGDFALEMHVGMKSGLVLPI